MAKYTEDDRLQDRLGANKMAYEMEVEYNDTKLRRRTVDKDNAQDQADIQRAEAKRLLNSAFNFGENTTSLAVDRAIDCIISAAVLESMLVLKQGLGEAKLKDKNGG